MRQLLPAIALLIGCPPHAESPHGAPATQPQCDYVNYHRDESVNVQGPSRCTTDCDCDGMRSCADGACTGEARPTDYSHCDDPSYHWNEAWNGGGSGVCANDCECDGVRTCVGGHCEDSARGNNTGSALTR